MIDWLISTTFLILLVLLLRFLFRGKLRPLLQYALWALVALRLLLPVPVQKTSFSLASAVTLIPGYVQAVNTLEDATQSLTEKTIPLSPALAQQERPAILDKEEFESFQSLLRISPLTVIWVCGSVLMALYVLIRNLLLRRAIFRRRIIQPEYNAPLPVYAVPGLPSPCLMQGRIYLPLELTDPVAQRHAIAHEISHSRHHDSLWSFLRCALCVLFWWNPLVWLAAKLSRDDMELACDAAAIEFLGEDQRLTYGKTLVDLVRVRSLPDSPIIVATTMSSRANSLRRRIRTIIDHPVTRRWAAAVLLPLLALGCIVTFTGAGHSSVRTHITDSFTTVKFYGGPARQKQYLPEEEAALLTRSIERAVWVSHRKVPSDYNFRDWYMILESPSGRSESLEFCKSDGRYYLLCRSLDASGKPMTQYYTLLLRDSLAFVEDWLYRLPEGSYTYTGSDQVYEISAAEGGYLLTVGDKSWLLTEEADNPLLELPRVRDRERAGYALYTAPGLDFILSYDTRSLSLLHQFHFVNDPTKAYYAVDYLKKVS